MIVLRALSILLCCVLLLSRLKIGGSAEYSEEGLSASLRVGAVWLRLYPRKKKSKKKEKTKRKKTEQKEPTPHSAEQVQGGEPTASVQNEANEGKNAEQSKAKGETQPKKGGKIAQVKKYLPLIGEAAGELRHKIVIDSLELRLTAAAQDAMSAAMAFGYSNMALGMFLPILEQNFTVKKKSICTDVDFSAQAPTIYVNAAVSLRLGQLVSFAARYFIRFLRIYRKENGSK